MHGEACEEESKRAYKGTQASDGEQTTKPGAKLTRFTPTQLWPVSCIHKIVIFLLTVNQNAVFRISFNFFSFTPI